MFRHKNIPNLLIILAAVLLVFSFTGCTGAVSEPEKRTRSSVLEDGPPADLTVLAAENDETAVEPGSSEVLGQFDTAFNPKNKSRSSNIARASDAINHHIVQPGETFSYNETVGPTSKKEGYKLGTIFIKGKIYEGYGGGVCQVSSTLYNAAANAGMTIVERHDHSLPVPYIETGRDAATSYGGIDFKFKNNKPYPIMINSHVDNGTISVSINAL